MFRKLLIKQLAFSAGCAVLLWLLSTRVEVISSHWPALVVFCTIINLSVMGLIAYGRSFDPKTAITFTMAAIAVHFFLSVVFIVSYLYFVVGKDLNFTLNFFVLYLVFLSFELYVLLNTLRAQS